MKRRCYLGLRELRSGLQCACGGQQIPFDRGGAQVLDAGAGGFGGGGVTEFILCGGELVQGEQRTRVGGKLVDRVGKFASCSEQITASGFVTVLDEQVARQRG